ncbi:type IV pilus assembly protein PilM [Vibrio sp.]|nr:type IV pilus assembly protein PilM [Vibrio sp.]
MNRQLVTGIDISHHSIKAVVLKHTKGDSSIISYQEIPLSDGISLENNTVNPDEIVKKLKELKKTLPWLSHKVAIAIPDNAVISKILQIDSDLDVSEREFAIMQAFALQSPFPIEELRLDFVPVENTTVTRGKVATYQVYATKKEVIESRNDAVSKAGFKPLVMDLQSHSLLSIWQRAQQQTSKENWAILDIGEQRSTLCMDLERKPAFHKEIPMGFKVLAETKEQDSNLTAFGERVLRQAQIAASSNGGKAIEGLWVTGNGGLIEPLIDYLHTALTIPVDILNVFDLFDIELPKKSSKIPVAEETFAVATGIALRGVHWQETEHVA